MPYWPSIGAKILLLFSDAKKTFNFIFLVTFRKLFK